MAVDHNNPQSRNEEILIATIDGNEYDKAPQSRMEELLLELKETIEEGGGGGGTTNYNDLSNQPQIEGHTLIGNKSASDLGLATEDTVEGILDGQTIDSFGDVETALANKQNTLTAGNYISIANDGTINVTQGIGVYDVYSYKFEGRVQSTNYWTDIIKSKNGVQQSSTRYSNTQAATPINIDDRFTLKYGLGTDSKWHVTLLVDSNEHQAGEEITWRYNETKDFTETFNVSQDSSTDLATKGDVNTAIAGKQDTLTFDDTPTDNSNNPVKSNGIYDALALKQNATDNSLETTAKTIVGAINEHEGDIGSLMSGLTNYELQNNINLEVPNRKNLAGNPYGVMLNSSGVFVSANVRSYIIPTNLGTITISVDDITKISDDVIRIGYCDDIPAESGTGVRVSSMTTNTYTITPNTGYKYIVVSNLLDNDYGWQDIQIELGSTATAYAPYIPSVDARLDAVESGLTNVDIALDVPDGTGKNLLNSTLNSYSLNGVTITKNNDGTYRLSGTATSTVWGETIGSAKLKAGTYKLVGWNPNTPGRKNAVMIYIYDHTSINDYGQGGTTFTLEEETTYSVNFVINNGTTIDTVIKPMITEDINATYSDFAPYIPSVDARLEAVESGLTNVENSITGISKGYYKAYVTSGKWYKIGDISATTWVIHNTMLAYNGDMLKVASFRYDGSSHTFNNNATKISTIYGSVGYVGMKFGTNSAELYIKASHTGTTTYTVLTDGTEGTLNIYNPIATTYTDSDMDLIDS